MKRLILAVLLGLAGCIPFDGGQQPVPTPDPHVGPLKVLIVYSDADLSARKYDAGTLEILRGQKFADWLEANQVDCRIWPDTSDTQYAGKFWQDAMLEPRESLPWMLATNGNTGVHGPLPKTVDELTSVLGRYLK